MSDVPHRSVSLSRLDEGVYLATNAAGATVRFGSNDADGFSPVELLLAAVAGCSAVDVDVVTGRRSPAEHFEVRCEADVVRDDTGNVLRDVTLTFAVRFPEGPAGDAARAALPRAVAASHERTCTVSRTIEAGRPVRVVVEEP